MSRRLFPNLDLYYFRRCKTLLLGLLLFGTWAASIEYLCFAQTPLVTSSGLNTQVSDPVNLDGGVTKYNITGGTRPGDGVNLFHSFGEFGIPENNIANFQNDSGLTTSNILSRVTGGNPSNIFGTIQTEGFGNANLFLMNPAGIIFGADASLNVGGAAHFTTADYIKLGDNVQFTALPSDQDVLLSVAPVASFGFLQANPDPISNDGSILSVNPGQSISLVGGDITIESGLNALGGEVRLASVASPGEVLHPSFDSAPNVNEESFMEMGTISLVEGALLNVSNDAAGTVIIRGGKLMMTNATISADTVNSNGAQTAIDIKVTGDISITDTLGRSALTARTTGSGNAGEVRMSSTNLDVTSTALPLFFMIDTHTSSSGKAGNVNIRATGNLNATGNAQGQMYFIDSGTIGSDGGRGGNITINAGDILFNSITINTGDWFAQDNDFATGSGGDLAISTNTLQIIDSHIVTDGFFEGKAGDLTIFASDIHLNQRSQLRATEFGGGGAVTITTDRLLVNSSFIDTETVDGQGAGVPWDAISITADIVELRNGSTIRSQTFGNGAAGNIRIFSSDRFILSDDPTTTGAQVRPTGVFTNSLVEGTDGPAGAIIVETTLLEMSGGARFDSTTQSNGRGGDITINATNSVSLSGQRFTPVIEAEFLGLGSSLPSGVFSRTVGNACTGRCGDAGNISISTGSIHVSNGALVDSGTTSTGRGGDITVDASEQILISGTLEDGTPGGIFSRTTGDASNSGEGGIISLTAGTSLSLRNNATITASSSGPANAGNINLKAEDSILVDNSNVTTQSAIASGGDISLEAVNLIRLRDSTIESSVQGNQTTSGGDISIDPQFVVLQNSNILATAREGLGGNIQITGGQILQDPFTTIDASSETGISGTVNIRGPIQNLSETIAPLSEEILKVSALFAARCAAQKGGKFSSFLQSGRDETSPGATNFLPSPLTFSTSGPEDTTTTISPLSFDEIINEAEWRFLTIAKTLDLPQGCSSAPAFPS